MPTSRPVASPGPGSALRQRGSVILFVLGMVLLTSLLLTRFIDRAHTELLTEARHSRLSALRGEAYSALQVTLAVLADYAAVDNGLHSPAQGWDDPLTYADYTPPPGFQTDVEVTDETGKLSLATADAGQLQALLAEVGCLPMESDAISDAILTWTRAEHTAQFSESDDDTYLQRDPALVPPRKALRTFAELKLMPAVRRSLCDESGEWNDVGRLFLQSVSLFAFDRVNLNTAGSEVLAALGLNGEQIIAERETAFAFNDRPAIFYTPGDVTSTLGDTPDAATKAGVDATCLRINITCRQGGRGFRLSVVVQPGGSRTQNTTEKSSDGEEAAPRPWTSKNIDSAFQILEVRENNGF